MMCQGSARWRLMLVTGLNVVVVALWVWTTPAVAGGDAKVQAAPARVVIRLDSEAELYVDDEFFAGRSWDTPPLDSSFNYYYTLRIDATRDGQKISVEKQIKVWAGATTTVDFSDLRKPVVDGPTTKPASARSDVLAEEQEVIDHINAYRQGAGLAPLRLNPLLCQVARQHSENMARRGRLDHYLDGKGPSQRCADAGYTSYSGENIASGSPSRPEAFFRLWVNSPGHRGNMLGNHTEVGVGFGATNGGGHYYTAVFGVGN